MSGVGRRVGRGVGCGIGSAKNLRRRRRQAWDVAVAVPESARRVPLEGMRDTAPSTGSPVQSLSSGERLLVVAVGVAVGLMWLAYAGGSLAAWLVGERLGVSGQATLAVIARLPQHLIDPAA